MTSQTEQKAERVHIELQRVQTWLFSVPRLRAMVGANALLGQVLRVELPDLAKDPAKAPTKGSQWSLCQGSQWEQFPVRDANDPLADKDDPRQDAKNGILARDGGHFEALFAHGAAEFAKAASELLDRELPGLRFSIKVNDERIERPGSSLSCELPVLAPCAWSGRGLSSAEVVQGSGTDKETYAVSLDAQRRHDAAKRAAKNKAKGKAQHADGAGSETPSDDAADLASLLTKTTGLGELELAESFEKLTDEDYLAVIHADGNGVGSQTQGMSEPDKAEFFHQNRVLLRRALQHAMDEAANSTEGTQTCPLTVLMLGGDDVLVVCRASLALRFVVDLCQELKEIQKDRPESEFRLTLGVGVVFSRPSVPFHRLHEVAEKLASSAKRLYRGMDNAARASVVDWASYTTAWADDPAEFRARDWVCGSGSTHRILSRRPLRVVRAGLDGDELGSLAGLISGAEKLLTAPRSQLHYLVETLRQGKTLAELAFAELSHGTKDALTKADVKDVWSQQNQGEPYLTSILDLVEVLEIPRLGVKNKSGTHAVSPPTESPSQEAAHG